MIFMLNNYWPLTLFIGINTNDILFWMLKQRKVLYILVFCFYGQLKFHAQLSIA